jgi:hypothetical protein
MITRLWIAMSLVAACGEPTDVPRTGTPPPPDPLPSGPFFEVSKCGGGGGTGDNFLALDVDGKSIVDCQTFGGARAKLWMRATPKGKLQLGATTLSVPDGGSLDRVVELGDAILGLSIDDFVQKGAAETPLVVPWKLDTDGKHLEGKLQFAVRFMRQSQVFRQWLRDILDGKVDRPAFTAAPAGERRTVLRIPPDDYGDLTVSDRRGTVRDLDVVAREREGTRAEAGECEFDSKGKVVRAKRFSVPVEVDVVELATGKVLAKKTFPAPTTCPSFVMMDPKRPEVAVRVAADEVTKWLAQFEAPAS